MMNDNAPVQLGRVGEVATGPGPAPVSELGFWGALACRIGARVQGRRTLGVFATLARAPRLFGTWLAYSAMMMPCGYMSRGETELIILRVAFLRDSAYELDQHRDLAARVGVPASKIEAVTTAQHGLVGREGVLLDAVDELVGTHELSSQAWWGLRRIFTAREQVAFVMLVLHYDGLASALKVLGVPVDERR